MKSKNIKNQDFLFYSDEKEEQADPTNFEDDGEN